jgi:hypothetical protein
MEIETYNSRDGKAVIASRKTAGCIFNNQGDVSTETPKNLSEVLLDDDGDNGDGDEENGDYSDEEENGDYSDEEENGDYSDEEVNY